MEGVWSHSVSSGRTRCRMPDSNKHDLLTPRATQTGSCSQQQRQCRQQQIQHQLQHPQKDIYHGKHYTRNSSMISSCNMNATTSSTNHSHIPPRMRNNQPQKAFPFLQCLTTQTLLTILLLVSLVTLASCSNEHAPGGQHRRPRDLPPPSEDNPNTPAATLEDETVVIGGDAGGYPSRVPGEPKGFSREDMTRLRAYIAHLMGSNCRDIPSVSIAMVQNGQTLASAALGWADLGTDQDSLNHDPFSSRPRVAADQHTLYCVASLSKAFTSALLAKMLDRKGQTLDVPVRDILGDKYTFGDDYVTRHVTVRDLLLHRTGIPRYDYLWVSGAEDSDAIFRRIRCMKHSKEFRTGALYNNIMYALAGHVAEQVGDASWETLLRRELLEPLGMTSTTFVREVQEDRASSPHNTTMARHYVWQKYNIDVGDPLLRGALDVSPALGVFSTAHDMAIWLDFHLSGGRNRKGHQLIPEHVMKDMHQGQVSTADMMQPSEVDEDGSQILNYDLYGLGWFTGHQRGYPVSMHYGSYPGAFSMITLLPEKGFGIFTSVNGGRMRSPYTINSQIQTFAVDLALDTPLNKTTNHGNSCQDPEEQGGDDSENCALKRGSYSISQRHIHKYAGTFSNPGYGNVTITVINDVIIFKYNQLELEVFPLTDNDFCVVAQGKSSYVFYPRNISFIFSAYREVEKVKVSFLGDDNVFYRLPKEGSYKEWLNDKCGTPAPPCEKIEALPEVASAAAGRLNRSGVSLMFLLAVLFA